MADIKLVHHTQRLPVAYVYFYDGLLVVNDGIITIPSDNINWLRAAVAKGYNHTPDGRMIHGLNELDEEIARQSGPQYVERVPQTEHRVRAGSRNKIEA